MLNIIERTGLTLHHMNKNRAVVHRDPLGILLARHTQRVHMGLGANEVINLVGNSSHLRVTLTLADQHHLHRCLFDFPQINRHDSLSLTVADTFNNRIQ